MEPSVNPIETESRLARIETKLDLHLARGDKHEDRITWLEKKVNYFIGVATVVNIVFMLFAPKIMAVLHG